MNLVRIPFVGVGVAVTGIAVLFEFRRLDPHRHECVGKKLSVGQSGVLPADDGVNSGPGIEVSVVIEHARVPLLAGTAGSDDPVFLARVGFRTGFVEPDHQTRIQNCGAFSGRNGVKLLCQPDKLAKNAPVVTGEFALVVVVGGFVLGSTFGDDTDSGDTTGKSHGDDVFSVVGVANVTFARAELGTTVACLDARLQLVKLSDMRVQP